MSTEIIIPKGPFGNWAGSVNGGIVWCVHMGNFIPVDREEFRKHNQNLEHKLISFATVIVLWTRATLLIKLIRILAKWKCIQYQNYAFLVAILRKQSFFCVVSVTGLELSYGKFFIPVTEIPVAKTDISE